MMMEALYAFADTQTPLIWTYDAITAFQSIQSALAHAPSVWYPDVHSNLRIYVDVSARWIYGLCEFSDDNRHWFTAAHASRMWKSEEVQLGDFPRQSLAVSFVMDQFRPYVKLRQLSRVIVSYLPLSPPGRPSGSRII